MPVAIPTPPEAYPQTCQGCLRQQESLECEEKNGQIVTHLARLRPIVKFLSQRNGSNPADSNSRFMRLTWLLSMAWIVIPRTGGRRWMVVKECGEG